MPLRANYRDGDGLAHEPQVLLYFLTPWHPNTPLVPVAVTEFELNEVVKKGRARWHLNARTLGIVGAIQ